jgi:hypothetical protein
MSKFLEITLRRAAAMREMASLGCDKTRVAILLDLDTSRVSQIAARFGIPLPEARIGRPGWLQDFILRDFSKSWATPSIMAQRYGTSRSVVNATICRLRKEGKLPPSRKARVRSVPPLVKVRWMWETGEYDTMEMARRFKVSESVIYNMLTQARGQKEGRAL